MIEEHGFGPPHQVISQFGHTEVTYLSTRLEVTAQIIWDRNKSYFSTDIRALDVTPPVRRDLEELYVAYGFGPPQDVPGKLTGGQHTVIKRIEQHGAALRLVLPRV